MICVTFRYFLYTTGTSIKFFVQGNQHTTELAEPLFYHGDAKANSFIEANSFVFRFCRIAIVPQGPDLLPGLCPWTPLGDKVPRPPGPAPHHVNPCLPSTFIPLG